MTRHFLPGFIVALGLLALGLLVAFTVGRYPVTLAELVEVLVSRLAGRATAVPPAVENVVLLVRGPRVVAAALVGAGMLAGVRLQAATAPSPGRVTVRVIDDGAPGGPAILSTQVVPLR